ncbi:tyrosine-protein phosphatase [Streptomyces sp. NPDC002073]|uniref:tyrosine-protein phosphatase n=1 Tax=Streptomyces sp. NBC_00239 TaxID=2903640 RepID=UPI002E2DE0A3|nr:tyrosine-protein phosphatase [Streptomyces sp. NBC_00239]
MKKAPQKAPQRAPQKALLAATAVAAALTLSLAVAPSATANVTAETATTSWGPGHGHERGHGHGHGHSRQAVPFTRATVTAAADGSYTLKWDARGERGVRRVEIRTGGKVVARGGASGEAVVTGLPAADRQWFTFDAGRGATLRLADRQIRLEGAVNFRDAGGYRTTTGQWVKMGAVYRSDALDKLTPNDQAKLQRLGIKTVYDLRMQDERDKAPDRVPAGASYVVADVFAGSGSFQTMPRTPEEAVRAMVDAERAMVSTDGGKKAYAQVFDGVRNEDARAVLFHCTAGKDRTGWANAALLTALGVPADTVMADYLASNDYRKAANDAILGHLPAQQAAVYKPMLDVRAEYLDAGYDEVRAKFGSFDRYLADALGLTPRALTHLKHNLLTD